MVDDTPDIRLLLRAVLSQSGFEVVEAPDGRTALDFLERRDGVDLVLLDVQMPDMDGWEVLTRIRDAEGHEEIPVVLCTVKSQLDDTARGWELGCDGFVNKPFSVTQVADVVRDVAGMSADERRAARRSALRRLEAEAER